MSEPKPQLIESKCMKENSTVTIEISTALYQRLQNLLMTGIPFADVEMTRKVLSTIRNSEDDPDAVTFHTRTLLSIISLIEDAAEKQGKIETRKIDKSTGKVVSVN